MFVWCFVSKLRFVYIYIGILFRSIFFDVSG
jgi:hypothetical protein